MQRLLSVLPQNLTDGIAKLNMQNLQEIRLRADKPAAVMYGGKKYFLYGGGLTTDKSKAVVLTAADLEKFLLNACQHSLHTFSGQLAQGFVMPYGGVRVGVCGTAVAENGKVLSFKEVSSLNVRIPREVKNCSKNACKYLFDPLCNVLVVSRPGAGKTTFLRDMIFQTSLTENPPNVLVADERNEIAGSFAGKASFDLGSFADVMAMADKSFAFECGVRTMTPDVLACDEISFCDISRLKRLADDGVKLFCTMHGETPDNIAHGEFADALRQMFDRFVFLTDKRQTGEVAGIFDNNFRRIDI